MKKKLFQKKDLLLILPILAVAVGLLLWNTFRSSGQELTAVVEENGRVTHTYDLSCQQTAQVVDIGGSYHVKLLVEPGKISFSHSDCPDQICVRTGKLAKAGQTAVCLPARVSVHIRSSGNEVDGTTG
ncbi:MULTISPECIES: NusG domain II-containing protein [Caproicibacterium]|jgi:hypothetical protein|uniref:NusG domain-containing protein n=1 Tax=Caproicibacterium lactatifermentans TaxID=2666138 RepID=A0A859DPY9_9FIRM|nr:NusG domain II-containing protein [Caproicibacterium lactatifermentans]ARP50505.1 hypothetical protein B6259_06220 [Ruminococcaceae bacterium CPB6]MDD4808030.1 NusG domain II-containing protein [Oscillospiraceae bacterium]QKN23776.1 hypothetical protein GJQ69_04345 [Caproicibacterium lactatifermentans]QKO29588.1 hypothetical protein GKP14_00230 [Caproicibacterium lactatifermentans]